MGTVERGESNLSFSNLLKVASTLGISLATLLEGIDQDVEPESRGSAIKRDDPTQRAIRHSQRKS
jgi:transcriptional regulator with XRE-family HTH domain